jgi:hypothetical protein
MLAVKVWVTWYQVVGSSTYYYLLRRRVVRQDSGTPVMHEYVTTSKTHNAVGVVRYEVGSHEFATPNRHHYSCLLHSTRLFIQENNTRLPPVTAHNTVLEYYYSGQSTA